MARSNLSDLASDWNVAGATSSVSCSLCQAGTYWAGSGSSFSEVQGSDTRVWQRAHCLRDGGVAIRNALPVCVILGCVACTDSSCLQEPLVQAPAACVSQEPTRPAQVRFGAKMLACCQHGSCAAQGLKTGLQAMLCTGLDLHRFRGQDAYLWSRTAHLRGLDAFPW